MNSQTYHIYPARDRIPDSYRPADKPLNTFYCRTLAASVHYDRSAGYFRSSALAAAAAGIVRLIQNNGHMRLLVGAELSADDVEAIKQGDESRNVVAQAMLGQFTEPTDGQLAQRLAALTWMVANGTLDIKVVLPLDQAGFPIAGPETQDYDHTKKGIFTDRDGTRLASLAVSTNQPRHGRETSRSFPSMHRGRARCDREGLRATPAVVRGPLGRARPQLGSHRPARSRASGVDPPCAGPAT